MRGIVPSASKRPAEFKFLWYRLTSWRSCSRCFSLSSKCIQELAHGSFDYIPFALQTNDVNQGDALEHDFTTMHTALTFPVKHIMGHSFPKVGLAWCPSPPPQECYPPPPPPPPHLPPLLVWRIACWIVLSLRRHYSPSPNSCAKPWASCTARLLVQRPWFPPPARMSAPKNSAGNWWPSGMTWIQRFVAHSWLQASRTQVQLARRVG